MRRRMGWSMARGALLLTMVAVASVAGCRPSAQYHGEGYEQQRIADMIILYTGPELLEVVRPRAFFHREPMPSTWAELLVTLRRWPGNSHQTVIVMMPKEGRTTEMLAAEMDRLEAVLKGFNLGDIHFHQGYGRLEGPAAITILR